MERLSSAEASLNKAKPLHFSVTQDEILDLPRTGSRVIVLFDAIFQTHFHRLQFNAREARKVSMYYRILLAPVSDPK